MFQTQWEREDPGWITLFFRQVKVSHKGTDQESFVFLEDLDLQTLQKKKKEKLETDDFAVLFFNTRSKQVGIWLTERQNLWFPELQMNRYPSTKQMTDKHVATKIAVNQAFATVIRQSSSKFQAEEKDHHILVLESPAMLTARVLLTNFQSSLPPSHLWCLSNEKLTVPEEPGFAGLRVIHDLFFRFCQNLCRRLDPVPDRGFKAIGYDACCTFDGAQGTAGHPESDLRLIFARQLLRLVGGILWVTFSTRTKTKAEDDLVPTKICEIAQEYYYHLKRIPSPTGNYVYTHSGRMIYFFFETVKQEDD